ncbi:MAG: hypothetical protein ABFD46_11760 [Armatimonadota bacterium]
MSRQFSISDPAFDSSRNYHYPNLPTEINLPVGTRYQLLQQAKDRQEIVAWAIANRIGNLMWEVPFDAGKFVVVLDNGLSGGDLRWVYLFAHCPLSKKDSKPWKLVYVGEGVFSTNWRTIETIYVDTKSRSLVFGSRVQTYAGLSIDKELSLVENCDFNGSGDTNTDKSVKKNELKEYRDQQNKESYYPDLPAEINIRGKKLSLLIESKNVTAIAKWADTNKVYRMMEVMDGNFFVLIDAEDSKPNSLWFYIYAPVWQEGNRLFRLIYIGNSIFKSGQAFDIECVYADNYLNALVFANRDGKVIKAITIPGVIDDKQQKWKDVTSKLK